MVRRRGGARVAAVMAAALAAICAMAASPGTWVSVAAEPNPYEFAEDTRQVKGVPSSTDAALLEPGATYRSSIGPDDGELYYRVSLDAESAAYVSAVAIPRLGTRVAYGDGLSARLLDATGRTCLGRGSGTARFSAAAYPRPIVASAERLVQPGGRVCQEAGMYHFVVERKRAVSSGAGSGSGSGSGAESWDLELTVAEEPGLKGGGGATTQAPPTLDSGSGSGSGSGTGSGALEPPVGNARERAGGTSFHTAAELGNGVWKDRFRPGQTRFYRVPLNWGQRLSAEATLGSVPGGGSGSVASALHMTLHSPARREVDEQGTSFRGDPVSAALDPLLPVAYENRYGRVGKVREMRSPGWYYLQVTLNPALRERYGDRELGVTLRVGVGGETKSGVEYAGDPGVFQVGAAGSQGGSAGDGAYDSGTLRVVAVAGIGTGSVLVLALGAWTLVARRRASVS
ncbi:hypothetical protein [Streptomyces apocyni]|uniref:hypothetical protein n=1 Tax=Streptomyces apocyni TaxID=2654677 RepID=UPI0012EAE3E4|nr:hypothetical protein [Streptomyces apocyni]